MALNRSYLCTWMIWFILALNYLYDSNADKLWVHRDETYLNHLFNLGDGNHRDKRYLPFPNGTGNKLQIITGFGIPVDLKNDDVTFGLIMKTNYALPTNSQQFTSPEEYLASDKQMTRWTFYGILKNALDRLSFDGENCLLKSICQAAFTAFEQNGLFGEILQVLFLPSTTPGEGRSRAMNEYEEAEMIGRESADDAKCNEVFQNCSLSLMDLITTLEEEVLEKVILKNI